MGLSSYGYSFHRDDKNCELLFFQESFHVLDALTLQTKAGWHKWLEQPFCLVSEAWKRLCECDHGATDAVKNYVRNRWACCLSTFLPHQVSGLSPLPMLSRQARLLALSQAIQSLATGGGGSVIVTVLAHRRVMISSTWEPLSAATLAIRHHCLTHWGGNHSVCVYSLTWIQ